MSITQVFEKIVDAQYRRPAGILGRIIGERMAKQHTPENAWTVSLLSVQPTDHILEVGFGPGSTIQLLAARATEGQVVGIDFSQTMVRVARERNAASIKAGRVRLCCGDVANLPFREQSFDKALSIHSLYFWPHPLQALKELQRVLKPGGILVLTLLPREKWPGGAPCSPTCRVYSSEDVATMMTTAGFASTRIEPGDPERFRESAVLGVKAAFKA